jgi:protein-L-isoaspartate(D-aspartate) O-methyltransferase
MNIEQARFNMIEQQIRPWDVLDQEVLNLLGVVKREAFVPAAYRACAFMDMEIPLGNVEHGEAMLAPRVEARLLQELHLKKTERVLEIGTGSGYMAALLAHRAAFVTTVELSPVLAKLAAERLYRELVINAKVETADGNSFVPAQPVDVIVLSGSVAEAPAHLLNLLPVGGRMAAIVGEEPMMRAQIITRVGEAQFTTFTAFDTVAPRLRNFATKSAFVL